MHITDDHRHTANMEKAVNQINKLNPPLVIDTGDIVDYGTEKQMSLAKEILSNLKAPLYVVPGNHDYYQLTYDEKDLQGAISRFAAAFRSTPYSFDYQGWHFVGIDSGMFYFHGEKDKVIIQKRWQEQMKWLKEDLEKNKEKNIVIFHHIPCRSWPEECMKEFISLINRYNVKCVLDGHTHENNEIKSANRAVFWTTNAISYSSTPFQRAGYRIIRIDKGKLSSEYRELYPFGGKLMTERERRSKSQRLVGDRPGEKLSYKYPDGAPEIWTDENLTKLTDGKKGWRSGSDVNIRWKPTCKEKYIDFDLGKKCMVESIVLYSLNIVEGKYPKLNHINIYTSEYGISYQLIKSVRGVLEATSINDVDKNMQFVRIGIKNDIPCIITLSEIEIWVSD